MDLYQISNHLSAAILYNKPNYGLKSTRKQFLPAFISFKCYILNPNYCIVLYPISLFKRRRQSNLLTTIASKQKKTLKWYRFDNLEINVYLIVKQKLRINKEVYYVLYSNYLNKKAGGVITIGITIIIIIVSLLPTFSDKTFPTVTNLIK